MFNRKSRDCVEVKNGRLVAGGKNYGVRPHTRSNCLAVSSLAGNQASTFDLLIRQRSASPQKLNFAASCTSRPGIALTIWPNATELMLPLTAAGPKNCA